MMKNLLGAGTVGAAFLGAGAQVTEPGRPDGPMFLDPRKFGAKGDGRTKDTVAIQRAIDQCTSAGGGTVYVSPGTYLTGTVIIKSNVTLYLQSGATLLGSTDLADYYMPPDAMALVNYPAARHLIFAFQAVNIGLVGGGTVDGQSSKFLVKLDKPKPKAEDLWRETTGAGWVRRDRVSPMVEIAQCKNVRIEGVTLQNSVGWTLRPVGCNPVFIRGVRVRNPDYASNADGIDPCSSENVMITDCDVDTGDDALCIKTSNPYGPNKTSRNITVTNCILSSACNGFKIGAEGPNDFENITFSNSVIFSRDVPFDQRVISGIEVVMADGGWAGNPDFVFRWMLGSDRSAGGGGEDLLNRRSCRPLFKPGNIIPLGYGQKKGFIDTLEGKVLFKLLAEVTHLYPNDGVSRRIEVPASSQDLLGDIVFPD